MPAQEKTPEQLQGELHAIVIETNRKADMMIEEIAQMCADRMMSAKTVYTQLGAEWKRPYQERYERLLVIANSNRV